ncbi:MAG: hypothetical protein ACK2UK_14870, partial [Candidatus Promineifilaceae bacterium]
MIDEDRSLTPSGKSWKRQIAELQEMLETLRPLLVAAEQRLSQHLSEISAFEFLVRSRLEPLNRRLERLEKEIRRLQEELRRMREDSFFVDTFEGGDLFETWRSSARAGSAASGEYRYHTPQEQPPRRKLTDDQIETLKQLYRKLARRFHPDFSMDEADRSYRTGIMMAVNAAYAAGDLERLRELTRQPDARQPDYGQEELAAALLREVHHCRRRLAEIEEEMARLHHHPSYLLKQRVDEAALAGKDLLERLADDLRERIAERMAQRDILQVEIESFAQGEFEIGGDEFADAVFILGLEQAL